MGNATRVKVVKKKVAPPFKRGGIRHHVMAKGISKTGELIDMEGEGGHRLEKSGPHGNSYGERADRPGARERQDLPQGQPRRRAGDGDKIRGAHGLDFDMGASDDDGPMEMVSTTDATGLASLP